MGKVRKHKQKAARVDPVGLDSAIAELQHGMDQVEYFSIPETHFVVISFASSCIFSGGVVKWQRGGSC